MSEVEHEAEPEEVLRRTWRPVSLNDVLDGTWQQATPTVGARSDQIGMFYPGKVHSVASESEAGKTWMALSAVVDEVSAHNHVIYIDFEDDIGGVGGRLVSLQVNPDLIRAYFHYIRPDEPLGTGINLDDLAQVLAFEPTLAVIDGITEAMTLHGLNPLDNKDIATFGRRLPRVLASAGPAVVCLDHVNKVRDANNRYAMGGVHKLNGIDGAAFLLENRKPFGIGRTGVSTIKVAKDRPGQLRKNSKPSANGLFWYGDLTLESHDAAFAELVITAPPEQVEDKVFRPTAAMERIWNFIHSKAPEKGVSGRQVQDVLKGNASTNRSALALLELEGHITPTPHKALKPYPPTENGDQAA